MGRSVRQFVPPGSPLCCFAEENLQLEASLLDSFDMEIFSFLRIPKLCIT
jgi:hypothetical protein